MLMRVLNPKGLRLPARDRHGTASGTAGCCRSSKQIVHCGEFSNGQALLERSTLKPTMVFRSCATSPCCPLQLT